MSDIAIQLRGVAKSFRRFEHPGWRVLSSLGWPVSQKHYDIFIALRDICFEVQRGERVAIIGRNGAGKSTLLRVIASQMRPDSGDVYVNGAVQALMELGTGFHPDFNGIENIRSALAYQGVQPKKWQSLIGEIIEFTELEAFINRPVREYSSGMYARLAFAVATAISPEILIIDEILGTGDAYFVGKCIQRMKALTSNGCTILFVSHDLGSIQLLCDRGIWLDRGRILQDRDLLSVSKAYLSSVRDDEEFRVRARSMRLSRSQVEQMATSQEEKHTELLHLIGSSGVPPSSPLAVSAIRFGIGELHLGTLSAQGNEGDARLIRDEGLMNWKGPCDVDGRACWLFGDFGGRYGHAPWQIFLHTIPSGKMWMEIEYHDDFSTPVAIERYDETIKDYIRLFELAPTISKAWVSCRIEWVVKQFDLEPEPLPSYEVDPISQNERYGSGEIRITSFFFVDGAGIRRHTLITGEPTQANILYYAEEMVYNPVAVIAIYRPDGSCAMQLISARDGFQLGELAGAGKLRIKFDPLLLGPGDYIISVAFFKEINLASNNEPEAYDLHDRCYALKVLPPPGIGVAIGIVNHPVIWKWYR